MVINGCSETVEGLGGGNRKYLRKVDKKYALNVWACNSKIKCSKLKGRNFVMSFQSRSYHFQIFFRMDYSIDYSIPLIDRNVFSIKMYCKIVFLFLY